MCEGKTRQHVCVYRLLTDQSTERQATVVPTKHLLGALAEDEEHGVNDVGFAAAVGSDDRGEVLRAVRSVAGLQLARKQDGQVVPVSKGQADTAKETRGEGTAEDVPPSGYHSSPHMFLSRDSSAIGALGLRPGAWEGGGTSVANNIERHDTNAEVLRSARHLPCGTARLAARRRTT